LGQVEAHRAAATPVTNGGTSSPTNWLEMTCRAWLGPMGLCAGLSEDPPTTGILPETAKHHYSVASSPVSSLSSLSPSAPIAKPLM
jgi:hypothetical protein